jgi:hypothetical protein
VKELAGKCERINRILGELNGLETKICEKKRTLQKRKYTYLALIQLAATLLLGTLESIIVVRFFFSEVQSWEMVRPNLVFFLILEIVFVMITFVFIHVADILYRTPTIIYLDNRLRHKLIYEFGEEAILKYELLIDDLKKLGVQEHSVENYDILKQLELAGQI